MFKAPGVVLDDAKGLAPGDDNGVASARPEVSPGASEPDAGVPWDLTPQDKAFWAAMASADRRLDELRRAIDEAAAETMAREAGAEASPSPNSHLRESRYEMAKRKITDALNAEKP
ncbi:hypothetical protein [Caulobacter sp. DWR1-3-2b1]|uniref:hypothetical protein n=1 Tax=Caulobacter sp. DWR1-3-2b1 TaxID=2804670 RepID=UPI003CF72F2D